MAGRLRSRPLVRAAAVLTLGWFFYHTLVPAWSRHSTDFPNYYTAGKLARTHQPLHLYYEWTWFQRQMHFAGIENQLGGYIPQTPLTLLPFVPLSLTNAATARKIWLLLNCVFLAVSLGLLSRITSLSLSQLWLIAFLTGDALRNNFLLGQYYVFLLALLTGAAWCVLRFRDLGAGALLASAFVLKLYGGPLVLLALMKRRWTVAFWFLVVSSAAVFGCVAWFGWAEVARYGTQVLPRAMAGETLNPFHPSNGTASTLLRRLFMKEGELNPHPIADSPLLFFFGQTAFTAGVLVFAALATMRDAPLLSRKSLAWWIIATLLISPNTASYTFVLIILPVALLFDAMTRWQWLAVLTASWLVALPLWPSWSWLFPRLWLLIFLFVLIGYRELKAIPLRQSLAGVAAVLAVSLATGVMDARRVRDEPSAHFIRVAFESGSIYSSSPVMTRAGLFYESIGPGHYVIRNGSRTFASPGDAFHPSAPDSGAFLYFQSVADFQSVTDLDSHIERIDLSSGQRVTLSLGVRHPEQPAVSHDGTMVAFTSDDHLYLFDGAQSRLLPTPVGVHEPSFTPDDRRIVFASGQAIYAVDLEHQSTTSLLRTDAELASPSLSPDGRTLLYQELRGSNWQVRIRSPDTGMDRGLTGGRCNSISPVWRPDSREVIFASDCGRGLGLPALYMTPPLDNVGNVSAEFLNSESSVPLSPAVH